ncbi:hypothetical protein BY458DRAFT_523995 [Sporodiniella umbellata]|nr:hypothetical protein BY458DRAFT_523995 [Sporodiniella umbellata]
MLRSSSAESSILTQTTNTTCSEWQEEFESFLRIRGWYEQSVEKKKGWMGNTVCRLASQGHVERIQQLSRHPATLDWVDLDRPDSDHRTALMYACCLGQGAMARYLLEAGVDPNAQDKLGWTSIMWAATNDHRELVEILLEYRVALDLPSFNGTLVYDLMNEKMRSALLPYPARQTFLWDTCLPHQMLVFSEPDTLLSIAITGFQLPLQSRAEISLPANILFLSARYAYYYMSPETLSGLLTKAWHQLEQVIKANAHDVHTLAFWISNLSQLICYFEKEKEMSQLEDWKTPLDGLLELAYTCLVQDSKERLCHILEPAMLDFEPLEGDTVQFAHDWQRFFRKPTVAGMELSPESVTHLLGSILYVLRSYQVPVEVIHQSLNQVFYYFSCELFNRILCNRRFLCRSRALQIRMNLTVVEEWLRQQALPIQSFLTPVVQMIQLLQCLSQLVDLMDFICTINSFDLLNSLQIKRLILQYRYELNETRLPDTIHKYSLQIAQDTRRTLPASLEETKDSSFLFPFQLVATSNERIPLIPDQWLIKLDSL